MHLAKVLSNTKQQLQGLFCFCCCFRHPSKQVHNNNQATPVHWCLPFIEISCEKDQDLGVGKSDQIITPAAPGGPPLDHSRVSPLAPQQYQKQTRDPPRCQRPEAANLYRRHSCAKSIAFVASFTEALSLLKPELKFKVQTACIHKKFTTRDLNDLEAFIVGIKSLVPRPTFIFLPSSHGWNVNLYVEAKTKRLH